MEDADRIERVLWMDALRLIACFAVICLHIAAPMVSPYVLRWDPHAWWAANIAMSLVAWCVPVFVMISGAANIGNERNANAVEFFSRRKSFFLRVVFWTAFYVMLRFIAEPQLTGREVWQSLIRGIPYYHLWFLYILVGLYLVTPLLCKYVRTVSGRTRIAVVILVLAVASLCTLFRDAFRPSLHHTALTLFLPFIGYYICGYALKMGQMNRRSHVAGFAVTLAAALLTMIVARCMAAGESSRHVLGWWYGSFGPGVIVMSVGIVVLARGIDPAKLRRLASLAPAAFGVYVLHPVFIPFVVKALGSLHQIPGIGIPVTALAVFAWSLITVLAFMRIPYLRRIFV